MNRLLRINRLLTICLFILPAVLARGNEEQLIAALYARGLAGDKQAVIDCVSALEMRLAEQPGDQRARVYLGSCWTLRSRDLPIGPGKLSAVRKGVALMDEAATAAPNDAKILLVRAVTNEALPRFLGRSSAARQQLDDLVNLMEKTPERLAAADRQLLYLNAGEAATRNGEKARAHDLWNRGLALSADPRLSAELQRALAQP